MDTPGRGIHVSSGHRVLGSHHSSPETPYFLHLWAGKDPRASDLRAAIPAETLLWIKLQEGCESQPGTPREGVQGREAMAIVMANFQWWSKDCPGKKPEWVEIPFLFENSHNLTFFFSPFG